MTKTKKPKKSVSLDPAVALRTVNSLRQIISIKCGSKQAAERKNKVLLMLVECYAIENGYCRSSVCRVAANPKVHRLVLRDQKYIKEKTPASLLRNHSGVVKREEIGKISIRSEVRKVSASVWLFCPPGEYEQLKLAVKKLRELSAALEEHLLKTLLTTSRMLDANKMFTPNMNTDLKGLRSNSSNPARLSTLNGINSVNFRYLDFRQPV